MRTYTLNTDQMDLVLNALNFLAEYGYEGAMEEFLIERNEVLALIAELEPKPVLKEGWMVRWHGGGNSPIFDTEQTAKAWYGYPKNCNGKVVKVTWEE